MAIVRLEAPSEWGYDTVTGEILLRCQESMPEGVDGGTWQPSREGVVRLKPVSVVIRDIPTTP